MPSEEQFKKIQEMSKMTRIAPLGMAPADVIDDSLPKPVTAAAMKTAVDRFKNAWFLGSKFFGKQQVEVDAFHLPNPESTKVSYVWTAAVGADGKSMLKAEAKAAETLDMRSSQAAITLANPDDEAEMQQAKARVVIETPDGFDEATLPCTAGAKETRGKVTLVLEGCDKDVLRLIVTGLEDGDRILPLNAQRQALESGESSKSYLFGDGRSIDQITYEEFKKGPGDATRVEMRAQGTVAAVRWLRPKAMKKVELEIVAEREPKPEDFGSKSKPRYEAPAAKEPVFTTVDAKTLALSFESGRACAVFGYNQPQIWLALPKAANTWLAKVELAPPKVKGGSKGGFELETNGLDEKLYRYKWTLAGKADGAPFSFASADVKATVKYPASVQSVVLAPGKLAENGVSADFQGHKVTVVLSEGSELADGSGFGSAKDLRGVIAFDASGMPLKAFAYTESSEAGTTYAFMGEVAKAKITTVSGWIEKKVAQKLKPGPLRPKDRAGNCSE